MFPGSGRPSIVAPFWSDVDTRLDGSVFYQVYNDSLSEILQRASDDVKAFANTTFNAAWGLVVTWDRVPNYPSSAQDDYTSLVRKKAIIMLKINLRISLF